jgi:hypothetical protein
MCPTRKKKKKEKKILMLEFQQFYRVLQEFVGYQFVMEAADQV